MNIDKIVTGDIGENCYIVSSEEGNCAVIDPGDNGDKIVAKIKALNLVPKMILITHGHYDHIGGIVELKNAFPEAEIFIGEYEKEVVDHYKDIKPATKASELVLDKAKLVKDGERLKLDELEFRVVHTPGHSQGGVVYICDNAMFSGDTLFYGTVGRCDLYTGDYPEILRTLKKLYNIGKNFDVYPGHDKPTTMENEKNINEYVQMALNL